MITWFLAAACIAFAISTVALLLARRRRGSIEPEAPAVRRAARVERDPTAPLDLMELGVLVLNASLAPVAANAAARRLLRLPETGLPVRLRSDELLSTARRAMNSGAATETDLNLWPERRRVRARAIEDGDEVIVFLDDITDEARAHQVRRQFVVNASHELKTPVAGIQALAETVNQAIDDDPDAAKRFARKLLIESERLSRLIQDLLDLSRLEDPAHFSDASVDVAAVAEKEAAGLRPLAEERGVTLGIHAGERAAIRGDEQQIGLLVRNLIDNAIRYTPAGGTVTIATSREANDVVLEVEDTGTGIPLNAQSRVFERFFRVDDDRSRASGGTGLGLSIVKHVAEMHGGHVSLRSELGEGSNFKVRLPILDGQAR